MWLSSRMASRTVRNSEFETSTLCTRRSSSESRLLDPARADYEPLPTAYDETVALSVRTGEYVQSQIRTPRQANSPNERVCRASARSGLGRPSAETLR